MIQTYDETWKLYARKYTSRRSDYLPFCMIDTLKMFLDSCHPDLSLLDVGCGENNLKLYYPQITGVDRTLEADVFAWVGDKAYNDLSYHSNATAVNCLHWNNNGLSIENNIESLLLKTQRAYITLNDNHPIEKFKELSYWKNFGQIEYYWHGQQPDTLNDIHDYLLQDHLFSFRHPNLSIEETAEHIHERSVMRDDYYGVVRAIINTL